MRVFTCNNFIGHNPVGTAAVVVADDVHVARQMLVEHLQAIGLPQGTHKLELTQVRTAKPTTVILNNGNY